ncbi:hydrogenase maturation nickel metallochaperone HypA/HybF [Thermopirellula anaerolimosa]
MHEVSLVEHLLDGVERELPERFAGARVARVVIHVGVLSGAHPEALRFAFDLLAPERLGEGVRLEIVEVPAVCRCRACGSATAITEPALLCPRCGSPDIRTEGGSDLILQEIELDVEDGDSGDATSPPAYDS